MSKVDAIMKRDNLTRMEGTKGVENLCRLCRLLGYKDTTHFGQLTPDASIGDLIDFLTDNSGAINAVVDWIEENEDAFDLPSDEDEE